MKILPASADDAAAVAAIRNQIVRDTTITFNSVEKSAAEIATLITDRHAAGHGFLVARQNNLVLGFATYGQFRDGVGYARTMEHTVLLSDTARGKGVGRALMTALETHAKQNGVHSMIAGVSDENSAAITFHKALGYEQVGHIPRAGRKFGRWLGVVLLQKFL